MSFRDLLHKERRMGERLGLLSPPLLLQHYRCSRCGALRLRQARVAPGSLVGLSEIRACLAEPVSDAALVRCGDVSCSGGEFSRVRSALVFWGESARGHFIASRDFSASDAKGVRFQWLNVDGDSEVEVCAEDEQVKSLIFDLELARSFVAGAGLPSFGGQHAQSVRSAALRAWRSERGPDSLWALRLFFELEPSQGGLEYARALVYLARFHEAEHVLSEALEATQRQLESQRSDDGKSELRSRFLTLDWALLACQVQGGEGLISGRAPLGRGQEAQAQELPNVLRAVLEGDACDLSSWRDCWRLVEAGARGLGLQNIARIARHYLRLTDLPVSDLERGEPSAVLCEQLAEELEDVGYERLYAEDSTWMRELTERGHLPELVMSRQDSFLVFFVSAGPEFAHHAQSMRARLASLVEVFHGGEVTVFPVSTHPLSWDTLRLCTLGIMERYELLAGADTSMQVQAANLESGLELVATYLGEVPRSTDEMMDALQGFLRAYLDGGMARFSFPMRVHLVTLFAHLLEQPATRSSPESMGLCERSENAIDLWGVLRVCSVFSGSIQDVLSEVVTERRWHGA